MLSLALHAQKSRHEPQPIAEEEDKRAPAPGWLMPMKMLDKHMPGWFQLDGEYRSRWETDGHAGFSSRTDGYLLSQFRLWAELKPARWLNIVGELQDSRIFFNQVVAARPPYENTWDIRQAYAQLGSPNDGWWDITGGRQIFSFGEERLIGPSDWLNMGRTFDAVRLDLHKGGNEVSLFASSVVVARNGVVDHHNEGDNFHGAYGSLKHLVPKTTIEPYVLWRVGPSPATWTAGGTLGHLDEVTTGVRVEGTLPAQIDYGFEVAKQSGSLGRGSIDSWAGHWNVGKTLKKASGSPRFFLEWNYASGTKDPATRQYGTFDQLYPSAHDKLGFADQVGWRNIKQVRTGVEEKRGKWRLKQTYESFWLATPNDGFYSNSGSLAVRAAGPAAGTHVGQELDFVFETDWNEALSSGFGYAQLFAGEFLRNTTKGRDYFYPYCYLTYRF